MTRLGIVLYHGIDNGAELREYGRIAEDAGYESLWVTERYFHEETFSLLGFLAATTHRIKLGVGVANPYTRNPALLAMGGATLDRISGGRFLLGLGRSEKAVIQGKMGIPYRRSRATVQDTVSILRRLFAKERVTTASESASLDNVRLALTPVQSTVPIYLAAIGPQSLRLAGTVADGVLLNAYVPPAYVRYAINEIHQAALEAGRDPATIDIACMLVIRLTENPTALMPGLKQRLVRLLDEPHVGEILLEQGGFDPVILRSLRASVQKDGGQDATRLITEEMVESFYVMGTATQCRDRIAAYRQAGVDLPLLLPRLEDYKRVAHALSA
jgi:5,10-methylenetetrahydromethanopterin reductase